MRFKSFYVFSTDASLIEVILSLWAGGDGALAVVVGLVSVVFPLAKLLLVAAEQMADARIAQTSFLDRLVPVLSKWSMMDVLCERNERATLPRRLVCADGYWRAARVAA